MTKINAKIVADSVNPYGQRITTYLLTYPRIIHAELLTHRMFSRNAASSRAIPFKTMVKSIQEDPFIPIAWQKDHKGMQGSEYHNETNSELFELNWIRARDNAIQVATDMTNSHLTKQIANRLLEPFQWYTCLVTATEYDNFFNLRCPVYETEYGTFRSWNDLCDAERDIEPNKDTHKYYYGEGEVDPLVKLKLNKGKAEIHLMELAECMWDAMNMSTPKQLKAGEWHIPFEDKINYNQLEDYYINTIPPLGGGNFGTFREPSIYHKDINNLKIKISTSMNARTSYTVVGNEKEFTYQNHIDLHNKLIKQVPLHASPMEHCAKVPTQWEYDTALKGSVNVVLNNGIMQYEVEEHQKGWFDNFHGFIPYRYILEHESSI